MSLAVFEVGAALLGACVGSFLNVVIYRLQQATPAARSLGGRSRCPRCGAGIRWSDNIPVFGWLLLRGRARCCGGRIAIRYPAVELLTASLFWWLWHAAPWRFGAPLALVDGAIAASAPALAAFACYAAFLALLVACTFIDLDCFLLPDVLTKPGMVLGLLAGLWPGLIAPPGDVVGVEQALRGLLQSALGLAVGGGATWLIRAVGSRVFRQEAMGFGDVKFLAMIGAFLGWQLALLSLFLGCVCGAVVGVAALSRRGFMARLPFGPYLAVGTVVALFWAGPILDFFFTTWPEWQRGSPAAQWFLLVLALFALVLLFALVRRGRRQG